MTYEKLLGVRPPFSWMMKKSCLSHPCAPGPSRHPFWIRPVYPFALSLWTHTPYTMGLVWSYEDLWDTHSTLQNPVVSS